MNVAFNTISGDKKELKIRAKKAKIDCDSGHLFVVANCVKLSVN
jgi:hypothetical protein